jgi:hypothetical protein
MKKALAIIMAVAMIGMLSVGVSSEPPPATAPIPNVFTDGDMSIGFFEFDENGVSNLLEIRTDRRPGGFAIQVPYALVGITRVRHMRLFGQEEHHMHVPNPNNLIFAGHLLEDFEFTPGGSLAYAPVEGAGTVTFGEGRFAISWQDGTQTLYALAGVVLSNVEIIPPEPEPQVTEPVATTPVITTEPPATTDDPEQTATDEVNPPTSVVFGVIPVVVAGAVVLLGRKRRV